MLCLNVMYKKCVLCTVYYNMMFTFTLARSHPEGTKTLGETWAAVIKATNSILWTSVATDTCLPEWGQSRVQYMPRRGPWSTYSQGLARCLKKTDVQVCTLSSVYVLFCNATFTLLLHTYVPSVTSSHLLPCTSCVCVITGVYFSQVKNKPWIPWVYTWFWHRRVNMYFVPC